MTKLHRTNINLYEEDVAFLKSKYGYGWTESIREIVHAAVDEMQLPSMTLEEYLRSLEPGNE